MGLGQKSAAFFTQKIDVEDTCGFTKAQRKCLGLKEAGDFFLIPARHLFHGRRFTLVTSDQKSYRLKKQPDQLVGLFKLSVSFLFFIPSVTVGAMLKGASLLSSQTRKVALFPRKIGFEWSVEIKVVDVGSGDVKIIQRKTCFADRSETRKKAKKKGYFGCPGGIHQVKDFCESEELKSYTTLRDANFFLLKSHSVNFDQLKFAMQKKLFGEVEWTLFLPPKREGFDLKEFEANIRPTVSWIVDELNEIIQKMDDASEIDLEKLREDWKRRVEENNRSGEFIDVKTFAYLSRKPAHLEASNAPEFEGLKRELKLNRWHELVNKKITFTHIKDDEDLKIYLDAIDQVFKNDSVRAVFGNFFRPCFLTAP